MSFESKIKKVWAPMVTVFLFLIFYFLYQQPINAQSFHLEKNNALEYSAQSALFEDGSGFFVGDYNIENGEIVLSHFFECGEEDWSRQYLIENVFVVLREMKFIDEEELLLYGSYFRGNFELIFIMKVDRRTGEMKSFKTLDPVFQDHFTYSVDILEDRIMIYGLLLDFNIARRCFVAELSLGLNINWAKSFTPFEKEGAAILTSFGIMGRSEEYHFALDAQGEKVWAQEAVFSDLAFKSIGGPYRWGDQYLFEAGDGASKFFYTLDRNGNLRWTSEVFPSTIDRSSLQLRQDDAFEVTYYADHGDDTEMRKLILNRTGAINKQEVLITDTPFATGSIEHYTTDLHTTYIGSPNPFINSSNAYQDFIIRLSGNTEDCFMWMEHSDKEVNNVNILFTSYDFSTTNLAMSETPSRSIRDFRVEDLYFNVCDQLKEEEQISDDVELACGEIIRLELPSSSFSWDLTGNSEDLPVREAGIYTARTNDCANPEIATYRVTSPDCECKVYLPNAISPNDDGINDILTYSTNCQLSAVRLQVFNRWGENVFSSKVLGQGWDPGSSPSGLYIALLEYETIGEQGKPNRQLLSQELNVIR